MFGTHCVRARHRLFLCVRLQYELADAGQTYGVNVAAASVDVRKIDFGIEVADQSKPLDMTLSPPPRAEVFFIRNALNPISVRAGLELTDENLRCTVKEYSKWVEKGFSMPDLRS